eukprot:8966843-Prorocentrum_lima.AAC.1
MSHCQTPISILLLAREGMQPARGGHQPEAAQTSPTSMSLLILALGPALEGRPPARGERMFGCVRVSARSGGSGDILGTANKCRTCR